MKISTVGHGLNLVLCSLLHFTAEILISADVQIKDLL